MSCSGFEIEAVDEDGALFGLAEYFFEIVVGDDLFFEILRDFSSPFLFILVAAHDGLQEAFASKLADVHLEVHGLIKLLQFSSAQLFLTVVILLKKSTMAELLFSLALPLLMLLMISRNSLNSMVPEPSKSTAVWGVGYF